MKNIIVLFFLFFSFTTFSQSFEWGVSVHPNYSNRRLIALGLYTEEDVAKIDSVETGLLSYSAGMFVNWQSEKMGLYLGLNYMKTGYQTIKHIILPDDPLADQYTHRRSVFDNVNLEVPITLQFIQHPDDKNSIYFNLGTAFSLNLQNTQKEIFYNGETRTVEEPIKLEKDLFRDINYAFQTGFAWKHSFENGMAITLEPVFVMWLKGVLPSGDLNRSIYSLGLRTSFTLGGYDKY